MGGGKSKFTWAMAAVVGPALFLGCFWLLLGFLAVLGTGASAFQFAASLAPGAGILLLTAGARRSPVPYGAGLIVVGLIPFVLFGAGGGWLLRLAFGVPLVLVGAAFLLLRDRIAPPRRHP